MLYLSGAVPVDPTLRRALVAAGIGLMAVPKVMKRGGGNHNLEWIDEFPVYAVDNGLYGKWVGDSFCLETYLRSLDRRPRAKCLFATAPDVFGDGEATLRLSLGVLPRIRAMGFPAAFVAQPGVPEYPWDEFDCLFMGGHDEFKRTEGSVLLREAKRRGKWCHIGRVNSTRRYLWAREQGYDSADGTHLAFAPTRNARRIISWVGASVQETLDLGGEAS